MYNVLCGLYMYFQSFERKSVLINLKIRNAVLDVSTLFYYIVDD